MHYSLKLPGLLSSFSVFSSNLRHTLGARSAKRATGHHTWRWGVAPVDEGQNWSSNLKLRLTVQSWSCISEVDVVLPKLKLHWWSWSCNGEVEVALAKLKLRWRSCSWVAEAEVTSCVVRIEVGWSELKSRFVKPISEFGSWSIFVRRRCRKKAPCSPLTPVTFPFTNYRFIEHQPSSFPQAPAVHSIMTRTHTPTFRHPWKGLPTDEWSCIRPKHAWSRTRRWKFSVR